tara:strand:+ start:78 stop:794 length:717 start_codon:yes stop_codon:yes gene_type:complete
MKIEFLSLFVTSFNHIFHKKILPIFLTHLIFTIFLAGIATFYFFDFLSDPAEELTSYLSGLYSYASIFAMFAKLILFILSWLLFTSILIPISSITGLIFENKIMDNINRITNFDMELSRNSISMFSFAFLILKNLFFYIFFNILALPFYFFIPPPFNIIIFTVINGYLLGMQTFHGIIINYYDKVNVYKCLADNRLNIFIIGSFLAFGFLIPILNLFAPLLTIIVLINYFVKVCDKYK